MLAKKSKPPKTWLKPGAKLKRLRSRLRISFSGSQLPNKSQRVSLKQKKIHRKARHHLLLHSISEDKESKGSRGWPGWDLTREFVVY